MWEPGYSAVGERDRADPRGRAVSESRESSAAQTDSEAFSERAWVMDGPGKIAATASRLPAEQVGVDVERDRRLGLELGEARLVEFASTHRAWPAAGGLLPSAAGRPRS